MWVTTFVAATPLQGLAIPRNRIPMHLTTMGHGPHPPALSLSRSQLGLCARARAQRAAVFLWGLVSFGSGIEDSCVQATNNESLNPNPKPAQEDGPQPSAADSPVGTGHHDPNTETERRKSNKGPDRLEPKYNWGIVQSLGNQCAHETLLAGRGPQTCDPANNGCARATDYLNGMRNVILSRRRMHKSVVYTFHSAHIFHKEGGWDPPCAVGSHSDSAFLQCVVHTPICIDFPSHFPLKFCTFQWVQSSRSWWVAVLRRVSLPKVPPPPSQYTPS